MSSFRCGPPDAQVLAAFARESFLDTYHTTHPPNDLVQYCATEFSDNSVAAALRDGDVWVCAARCHRALIGYVWLESGAPPDIGVSADKLLHMRRLFVSPAWHGRGVAGLLMARCLEEAAHRSARGLWLAVWQNAKRPIAFYEKAGFRIAGTSTFAMSGHIDRDFIMVNTSLPAACQRQA